MITILMNLPEKFACVFPGQGSQSVGMMNGYADFPIVRETFAEASDILGEDFWAMVRDGPADKLNLTVNTQPLMLMAGIAVYRAWKSLGDVKPVFMAGHSLGGVYRVGGLGGAGFCRCAATGAFSRGGDATGGAGRHRAPWLQFSGLTMRWSRRCAMKSQILPTANYWNRQISTHLVR